VTATGTASFAESVWSDSKLPARCIIFVLTLVKGCGLHRITLASVHDRCMKQEIGAVQSMVPYHRKRQRSSLVSPFGGAPAQAGGLTDGLPDSGRPRPSLDSGMQLLSSAAELDSDPAVRSETEARGRSRRAGSPRDTPNNSSDHQQVLLCAGPTEVAYSTLLLGRARFAQAQPAQSSCTNARRCIGRLRVAT
jgi:hypothetical protein